MNTEPSVLSLAGIAIAIVTSVIATLIAAIVLRKITDMDKKGDKKEYLRKQECILTLKNIDAIGSLAEQTARVAKGETPNGDLDEALKYRKRMKHELEDFLINANAERR